MTMRHIAVFAALATAGMTAEASAQAIPSSSCRSQLLAPLPLVQAPELGLASPFALAAPPVRRTGSVHGVTIGINIGHGLRLELQAGVYNMKFS